MPWSGSGAGRLTETAYRSASSKRSEEITGHFKMLYLASIGVALFVYPKKRHLPLDHAG